MKKVTARVKSLEKILASSEIDVYREEGVYFSKGFAWNFKMNENIGKTIELTKDTRDWIHYDYAGVDDKHGYKKEWLEDITEAVDWDDVKNDDKVLVRNNEDNPWIPAHFKEYYSSAPQFKFATHPAGSTSWTGCECHQDVWKYCKLAD